MYDHLLIPAVSMPQTIMAQRGAKLRGLLLYFKASLASSRTSCSVLLTPKPPLEGHSHIGRGLG